MPIQETAAMTESEKMAARNSNTAFFERILAPLGIAFDYFGTTEPDRYGFCDGRKLSKITNPDLFDVIGYTYGGSGDYFNIPDLRERVTVGFKSDSTYFNEIGKKLGESEHQLTIQEMPKHKFKLDAYGLYAYGGDPGSRVSAGPGFETDLGTKYTEVLGGDVPHNNIQMTFVCHKIMRLW